jgi:RimJ/RimL family protein N-acetyltransferase
LASGQEANQIVTGRLKLRPLRERDMVGLAKLSASDAVRQNLTIAIMPNSRAGHATFAAERRSDRAMIGAAGYCPTDAGNTSVEFALWISDGDWGRGYGTELAQSLIDHVFAGPTVGEVCAAVRISNGRGRSLLEKCGFQSRGTGMARGAHGSFPVERFVLSRHAWASLKAWGSHSDGRQSAA